MSPLVLVIRLKFKRQLKPVAPLTVVPMLLEEFVHSRFGIIAKHIPARAWVVFGHHDRFGLRAMRTAKEHPIVSHSRSITRGTLPVKACPRAGCVGLLALLLTDAAPRIRGVAIERSEIPR